MKSVQSLVIEAVPAGRPGVPKDKLPGLLLGRTLLLANDEPKLRPLPPPPAPEVCTALVRWFKVRESGSEVPVTNNH